MTLHFLPFSLNLLIFIFPVLVFPSKPSFVPSLLLIKGILCDVSCITYDIYPHNLSIQLWQMVGVPASTNFYWSGQEILYFLMKYVEKDICCMGHIYELLYSHSPNICVQGFVTIFFPPTLFLSLFISPPPPPHPHSTSFLSLCLSHCLYIPVGLSLSISLSLSPSYTCLIILFYQREEMRHILPIRIYLIWQQTTNFVSIDQWEGFFQSQPSHLLVRSHINHNSLNIKKITERKE